MWRTHTRTSIINSHALSLRTSIFDDRTRTRTFLHRLIVYIWRYNSLPLIEKNIEILQKKYFKRNIFIPLLKGKLVVLAYFSIYFYIEHAYYGKKREKQVKKCDRKSQVKNCPYARTFARTVPNTFCTHFRTHIACAVLR